MNHFKKHHLFVTVALVIVLAQAALALGPAQVAGAKSSLRSPGGIPALWVSETTHNIYHVRIEGNTFYAEKVNIPPSEIQQGAYIRTECRRKGSRWLGTTRSVVQLEAGDPHQPREAHWCHLVTRTEIFNVTAERITGRAEALKRVDIPQCRILEKEWKNFVWAPAK